jgi:hypothetical protein
VDIIKYKIKYEFVVSDLSLWESILRTKVLTTI